MMVCFLGVVGKHFGKAPCSDRYSCCGCCKGRRGSDGACFPPPLPSWFHLTLKCFQRRPWFSWIFGLYYLPMIYSGMGPRGEEIKRT
ncbi:hypothetical protein L1987_37723 [Smallanthus sonchifolius]|uniref:Uncharacterized protein n=1 Tax=Smallanthus sonchifolius TaxID=185202 RepID=A0ACB9HH55_9ASTR|nr:hypothetical protein L1987_37723 [Smallanthus sonchifolius]